MTLCRCCSSELISNVNWSPSRIKSKSKICKTCHNSANRKWKSDNPELLLVYGRAARAKAEPGAASAATSRWRRENPEKEKLHYTRWNKENPDKAAAKTARRRARKRFAEAKGADQNAINSFYALAKHMTMTTGVPYEVDHIIPLVLGGIHHQENLVVMRRDYNRAKGSLIVPQIVAFLLPGYTSV